MLSATIQSNSNSRLEPGGTYTHAYSNNKPLQQQTIKSSTLGSLSSLSALNSGNKLARPPPKYQISKLYPGARVYASSPSLSPAHSMFGGGGRGRALRLTVRGTALLRSSSFSLEDRDAFAVAERTLNLSVQCTSLSLSLLLAVYGTDSYLLFQLCLARVHSGARWLCSSGEFARVWPSSVCLLSRRGYYRRVSGCADRMCALDSRRWICCCCCMG